MWARTLVDGIASMNNSNIFSSGHFENFFLAINERVDLTLHSLHIDGGMSFCRRILANNTEKDRLKFEWSQCFIFHFLMNSSSESSESIVMIPSSLAWLGRLMIAGVAWSWVAKWGKAAVIVDMKYWGGAILGTFCNRKFLWLDFDVPNVAMALFTTLYFCLPVDLNVFAMLGKRFLCAAKGERKWQVVSDEWWSSKNSKITPFGFSTILCRFYVEIKRLSIAWVFWAVFWCFAQNPQKVLKK